MDFKPFSLSKAINENQAIQLNKLKIGMLQEQQQRKRDLRQIAAESVKPTYSEEPTYREYEDPAQQMEGAPLPEGLQQQTGTEQVQTGTEYDPEMHQQKLAQAGEIEMAGKIQDYYTKASEEERTSLEFESEQAGRAAFAADTPDKWVAAQESGDIPMDQGFEKRDTAITYARTVKDLMTKGGTKPTAAANKRIELLSLGLPDDIATGIGYSTYRQVTDDQGNISIYDLRRQGGKGQPLDPNEAAGLPSGVIDDVTGLPTGPRTAIISKGTKEEVRKEKQAIAAQQKLDKEHQSIKDDLVDQGDIGGLDSSLAEVEKILTGLGEKDVPGFGATAIAPDIAISTEGKNLRGAVASVFNRMLKLRSGAAVTDPELRRLMTEFGKGNMKTDDQLREGLKKARLHLNKAISNIAAGYTPEAIISWDKKAETLGNTLIGNRGAKEVSDKRKRLEYLRKKAAGATE